MSLCLWKDSQFARMFGPNVAARAIPLASYALFAMRDSLTIFASFNLPPVMAPRLPQELEKSCSRLSVAQFVVPAAVQVISTPLHLLGLDLYNRPCGVTLLSRLQRVGRDYLGSSCARIGRIVPAFGVGGVVNASMRRQLMGKLET